VVRFWNNDVTNNLETVLNETWNVLQEQETRRTGGRSDKP